MDEALQNGDDDESTSIGLQSLHEFKSTEFAKKFSYLR